MTKSRGAHHHGNLREALVEAGIQMLADGQALTLRGAAQRAGVSHAAPAHHFDGIEGLKLAIAQRGFEMFLANAQEVDRNAPKDPFARLLTLNLGYIAFARREEPLFRLMFDMMEQATPALMNVAGACYGLLAQNCAPFADSPEDAARIEAAVWALTHGYVALNMDRQRPNVPAPPPDYEVLLRMILPMDPKGSPG